MLDACRLARRRQSQRRGSTRALGSQHRPIGPVYLAIALTS